MMIDNKQIILFDGVCNLCNKLVKFIIKKDKHAKFRFASIQSTAGQKLLRQHNLPLDDLESFVLIIDNIYFLKSSAGLHILKELGSIWKLFYIFIIIPIVLRDFVYDRIANSRYKIFGKQDSCMVPTAELKDRFLS